VPKVGKGKRVNMLQRARQGRNLQVNRVDEKKHRDEDKE